MFNRNRKIINHCLNILYFYLLSFAVIPAGMASNIAIGGSGTDLGSFKLLAKAFTSQQSPNRVNLMESMGSGGGMKALNSDYIDIALLSPPAKTGRASCRYACHLLCQDPPDLRSASTK